MKKTNNHGELIGRRGELMAELFLQELNPFFLARNTSAGFGVDFFIGFQNQKGGLNLVAIEVKATERPVKGRYQLSRHTYDLLANSNIPGLLLVVDVKENRLFYREIGPIEVDAEQRLITVEVTEANETNRQSLTERLSSVSVS